jgi:hypothetical protein
VKQVLRIEGAYSFPTDVEIDAKVTELMDILRDLASGADGGEASVDMLYPADDAAIQYLLPRKGASTDLR